jgi:hypothetical protein
VIRGKGASVSAEHGLQVDFNTGAFLSGLWDGVWIDIFIDVCV